MKTKPHLFLAVISLLFLFTLAGCKKVENNITGVWKLQYMTETNLQTSWDFKDDGTLVRTFTRDTTDGGDVFVDTAFYSVESKINYSILKLVETSANDYNPVSIDGNYRVEKINSKVLIMTRIEMVDETTEGAYYRRELYRP